MKFKLLSLTIILCCIFATVSAGLLSVYRSEGKIFSEETHAKIEAFVQQFTNEDVAE